MFGAFFVSFRARVYMRKFVLMIDFSKYDITKAKELAAKFGSAALNEMVMNIHSLDLIDRGILLNSLKYGVKTKGGEVDRIQFSYEWYGRFQNTGANNIFGTGKALEPTNWRSDAISNNMPELNQDFAELYASLILEEITVDSVKMEM